MVDTYMRIYQCSGYLFTVTQRKVSVIKHWCLFSLHTQLILLAGVRAENRDGRTAAVADFYTLISTYSCCSQCTQIRSMKLLFGSQNFRSLHTTNFWFLKGVKICFKNHTPAITVSSKCRGEAAKRCMQCERRLKYFARFSTYANACVGCHRLCRSSVKPGELECKHAFTVQIII